jgi:carbonic anhydrase
MLLLAELVMHTCCSFVRGGLVNTTRNAARLAAVSLVFALGAAALRAEDPLAPADALRRLQVGHARFLCGKVDRPHQDAERREDTFKNGQHPFAVILSCADSRVPVELIFDQGIGDLFTIRVAGNVADAHEAGSIEYAVEHLHVPLVVVMGHRNCGAVAAAAAKTELPANIGSLVAEIRPAIEKTEKCCPTLSGDAFVAEAVRLNVFNTVEALFKKSPVLAAEAKAGKVRIVGAVYDLESGGINWLGPHPEEAKFLAGAKDSEPTAGGHAAPATPAPATPGPGEPPKVTRTAGQTAEKDPPLPPAGAKPPAAPPAGSGHGGHP